MAKRRRRKQPKQHRDFLDTIRPHYDRLLEEQGGGCAICRRPPSERRRLDIDHWHHEMRYRALLCSRCNRALPYWVTSAWLRSAAQVLDSSPPEWLDEALDDTLK